MLVCSRTVSHVLETRTVLGSGEKLAPSKVQILRLLALQGHQTPTQISHFLSVTRSAVTQLVDSMVEAGLVRRSDRDGDRRSSSIQLSSKGQKLVAKLEEEQLQIVRNAWRASGAANCETWVEMLTDISNSLTEAVGDLEQRCYQCGAYADGSCVLVGGKAACRYEASRA